MQKAKLKIKRETLSDKVEKNLKDMLADGQWKEGERLPSTAELAKSFGVSQQTVRVALQGLNTQGLVDIRHGDGVFAQKFSVHSYMKQVSDLYISKEMMDDVCDFRKVIEVESLHLAMERATEEDISAMQKSIDRYTEIQKEFGEDNPRLFKKYAEEDFNFHYGLCKASHNSLLTLSYSVAENAIRLYLEEINSQRRAAHLSPIIGSADGTDVHQLILNAIKKKNFEQAEKLVVAMIDYKVGVDDYINIIASTSNL